MKKCESSRSASSFGRSSASSSSGKNDVLRVSCSRKQKADFDYEPAIYCACGHKTARWTSWTDNHPGMRFNKCRYASEQGGCGFFRFVDGQFVGRAREVIVGLRDSEKELVSRNNLLESDNSRLILENEKLLEENNDLKMKNIQLAAVAGKDSAMKINFLYLMLILVVIWQLVFAESRK